MAATAITNVKTGLAGDYAFPGELMEIVNIDVNCTTANVLVICGVISANVTLVNFPAEINMNAIELENATEVMVDFQQKVLSSGLFLTTPR